MCNDNRRPGKLAPYEKKVLSIRAQGITYLNIHEIIKSEGYTGSVASLRVFMQKERSRIKTTIIDMPKDSAIFNKVLDRLQ